MTRRALLLAILASPWPAVASMPEKGKPKPPPPKPSTKPLPGDKRAPDADHNRTPQGQPRWPKQL